MFQPSSYSYGMPVATPLVYGMPGVYPGGPPGGFLGGYGADVDKYAGKSSGELARLLLWRLAQGVFLVGILIVAGRELRHVGLRSMVRHRRPVYSNRRRTRRRRTRR